MARDSGGTFTLASGNPVVSGTTITPTWANGTLSDIASEITNSLDRGGRTVWTADLPAGGYKLTGMGAGSAAGHSVRWEQVETNGYPTVTLSSMSSDIATPGGTLTLLTGSSIVVSAFPAGTTGCRRKTRFDGVNTLVHSSGLQLITSANITTASGDTAEWVYTGSAWVMIGYQKGTGQALSTSFSDGTVGAPGMSFVSDTDTGFYRPSANTTRLAAGGSMIADFNANNINFYSISYTGGAAQLTGAITLRSADHSATTIQGGGDTGGTACGDLVLMGGTSSSSGACGRVILKSGLNAGAGVLGGSVLIGVGDTPTDPGTDSNIVIQGPTKSAAGTLLDGYGQVFIRTGAPLATYQNYSRVIFSARVDTSTTKDLCQVYGDTATWEWRTSAGTPSVTGAGTSPTVAGTNYGVKITFGTSPTDTITVTFASRGGRVSPNAPVIVATYEGAGGYTCSLTGSSASSAVVKLSGTPLVGEKLHVMCMYYSN